jgi:hypothetical protein
VRDIGDKGALHIDEAVLLIPVDKNYCGACENQGEQDGAFGKREPAQAVRFNLGPEPLRHLAQLRVFFQIPPDPDDHQKDPEDLDGKENGDRMNQPLRFELDALNHDLKPASPGVLICKKYSFSILCPGRACASS